MKLTGKCKENFEKWLLNWIDEKIAWETETPSQEDIDHFYKFPDSMQWGVLVDFFDSVGIRVFIDDNINSHAFTGTFEEEKEKADFGYKVDYDNYGSFKYKTRPEARTAAIGKANNIYNNKTL